MDGMIYALANTQNALWVCYAHMPNQSEQVKSEWHCYDIMFLAISGNGIRINIEKLTKEPIWCCWWHGAARNQPKRSISPPYSNLFFLLKQQKQLREEEKKNRWFWKLLHYYSVCMYRCQCQCRFFFHQIKFQLKKKQRIASHRIDWNG